MSDLGHMGWGNLRHTPQKNLYNERVLYDVLCDNNPQRISTAYAREESKIETKVRKYFEFDEGWLCSVVEDLVYFGKYRGENGGLSPGPQALGNCVAYANSMVLASKIAHEMYVDGDYENLLGKGNLGMPYIPYSYKAGRIYIGGVNWRSDGSLGTWQQKANMEYGFIPCDHPGLQGPFPQSTASITRSFNKSDLDNLRPHAVKYDLSKSRQLVDIDDLKHCLIVEKSPCEITSNWGFRSNGKDSKYGIVIYRPSGTWAHAIQIIGCITIFGEDFYVVRNQWGRNKHDRPGRNIPKGCFIVTSDTMKKWLKDAFCFSISEVKTKKISPEFQI